MKASTLRSRQTRNSLSDLTHRGTRTYVLGEWHRLWFSLAGLAALAATLVDAVLLQRKYQIFTGGFLSTSHLESPLDIVLFMLTSLIADFGVTVTLAGASLWCLSRAGLNARPSILLVLVVTVAPFMVMNFIAYQIYTYLGDTVDFALTFEIADRSPAEIFAVAVTHLLAPLLLLAASAIFAVLLIWLFKRLVPGWAPLPRAPGLGRLGLETMVIILAALVVTGGAQLANESLERGLWRKPSGRLLVSIVERVSDVDGDGYGIMRRPFDPAPFNRDIFPYAVDIPGNGIDENGVAGDLPADSEAYKEGPPETTQWAFRPNVILILLESFRADLIGATHQGKAITPVLNALVESGAAATAAFSHNGFTAPSRHHLFSGSLPNIRRGSSLIDDFKANGYEVVYFSAQDAAFGGKRYDTGFARSDLYYDAQVEPNLRYTLFATPASIALPYQVMIEKVSEFLDRRQSDSPLFLYVNFQDTHFPYYHHKVRELISRAALPRASIGPDSAAELWATYVNTAANVDLGVGKVLNKFKESLGDPEPGIIITSDHGESLYDDGYLGHGIVLNDVQTQVPLIVVNLPTIVDQPFGQVQLRDAIRRALESEPQAVQGPIFRENPQTAVFQYLGNIERPRQIALKYAAGRTTFDFRSGRFQTLDGVWRKPDALSEVEEESYRSLIHEWERMVGAAHKARRDSG